MLKEFVQYLIQVTKPEIQTVNELPYTDRSMNLIVPPVTPAVSVETLGALVTLADKELDDCTLDSCFVQIHNHHSVSLFQQGADEFGRRRQYIYAKISDSSPFRFGDFMDPEAFVIALNCHFVETKELKALLVLASNLTAENVAIAEDDGFSQKATTRTGIALKSTTKIEPKVVLKPYRTFREVDQPASTFLFRLRTREGMSPSCALFEADGGAWKLAAVKNIGEFLAKELGDVATIVF